MREIYVCLHCRNQYLPANPGEPGGATLVHCGQAECARVVPVMVQSLGLPEQRLSDAARKAAGVLGEPRVPRRRYEGRARRGSPGGRRTKLL
ncbi:hypothetical protein DF268_08605 [Streptomyces sp. V2]|uniref:hypothetical protein n=1 Tax=Streptomyces sp. V2 TaxID=1424099 RepID=UPI000D66C82C|nr:hypothetical protein [Streptomyces sp. V2]PWG13916.1 hypothetical protein DF268_08605 [Streptomyces sp. V2]